jgi:hypothetical protein
VASAALELTAVRRVAGPVAEHPVLDYGRHDVSLEQQCQAGHVVLVRVGQHDQVQPSIPRRHPSVEGGEQPVRVGAGVDQHPAAARTVEQQGVALPDIQHRDPQATVGPRCGDEHHQDQQCRGHGDPREQHARAHPSGVERRRGLPSPNLRVEGAIANSSVSTAAARASPAQQAPAT